MKSRETFSGKQFEFEKNNDTDFSAINSNCISSNNNIFYIVLKRVIDFLFSLVAIILLAPILIITAVSVVIDDPKGGPIFSQIRVGKNGKKFKMYKFRSMIVNAEDELSNIMEYNEVDGPAFKMLDDPRITRVGKFIRKTCIDELPQLFNILKGDMSIVGPRPALPQEVETYNDFHKQRLIVTPGLTCYWQIHPDRYVLSFDEWVNLDIEYIKNRNVFIDFKLVFETISFVFKGLGR